MPNSTIKIKCQVCPNEWYEDVERIKQMQASIHKTLYRGGKTSDYRVTCPKCGTVNIVTVREEANDG